jgi:S-DNA-T family DNA segregation ATPase FtsK/SpoIIIE
MVMDLPILLGSSYEDNSDVRLDLAAAPHLLVAGTTGSGKSVFLNSLLIDLLEFSDAYLMLVDPKRVEFFPYKAIAPVYVETDDAVDAFRWLAARVDERFKLLERHEVRDIGKYNGVRPADDRLRRIVMVVDELANLMLGAKAQIEVPLTRIAQMGRAAGIHLVLATQRPTVDVVTGLLKANIPARVAFNVITDTDSRVILDETGAEDLIHPGQMLVRIPGSRGLRLMQGRLTTLEDVEAVVNRYKEVRT